MTTVTIATPMATAGTRNGLEAPLVGEGATDVVGGVGVKEAALVIAAEAALLAEDTTLATKLKNTLVQVHIAYLNNKLLPLEEAALAAEEAADSIDETIELAAELIEVIVAEAALEEAVVGEAVVVAAAEAVVVPVDESF